MSPDPRHGAFVFVGITDESDACECCGRTRLKRVVVLRRVSDGEVVRYGTTCAAFAQLGRRLDHRQAANFVAGELRVREIWRGEADGVAKAFAERGASSLAEVPDHYCRQNRRAPGTLVPEVVWTNGARWFGWSSAHPAFEERLTELGWSRVAAQGS